MANKLGITGPKPTDLPKPVASDDDFLAGLEALPAADIPQPEIVDAPEPPETVPEELVTTPVAHLAVPTADDQNFAASLESAPNEYPFTFIDRFKVAVGLDEAQKLAILEKLGGNKYDFDYRNETLSYRPKGTRKWKPFDPSPGDLEGVGAELREVGRDFVDLTNEIAMGLAGGEGASLAIRGGRAAGLIRPNAYDINLTPREASLQAIAKPSQRVFSAPNMAAVVGMASGILGAGKAREYLAEKFGAKEVEDFMGFMKDEITAGSLGYVGAKGAGKLLGFIGKSLENKALYGEQQYLTRKAFYQKSVEALDSALEGTPEFNATQGERYKGVVEGAVARYGNAVDAVRQRVYSEAAKQGDRKWAATDFIQGFERLAEEMGLQITQRRNPSSRALEYVLHPRSEAGIIKDTGITPGQLRKLFQSYSTAKTNGDGLAVKELDQLVDNLDNALRPYYSRNAAQPVAPRMEELLKLRRAADLDRKEAFKNELPSEAHTIDAAYKDYSEVKTAYDEVFNKVFRGGKASPEEFLDATIRPKDVSSINSLLRIVGDGSTEHKELAAVWLADKLAKATDARGMLNATMFRETLDQYGDDVVNKLVPDKKLLTQLKTYIDVMGEIEARRVNPGSSAQARASTDEARKGLSRVAANIATSFTNKFQIVSKLVGHMLGGDKALVDHFLDNDMRTLMRDANITPANKTTLYKAARHLQQAIELGQVVRATDGSVKYLPAFDAATVAATTEAVREP